jgi:L-threonylcarbamoyladenylate synthase
MESTSSNGVFKTRILPVNTAKLGYFTNPRTVERWELQGDECSLAPLREAAHHLKWTSVPVGFPTETVYGLGADATRSEAVKGIYKAKGRPSDNPLIVHVCDLTMLRSLLAPSADEDPIPGIYKPLIKRFWPGPLTILLPNPKPSQLAPEVTAGLPSFGARMPESPLALSLIYLSGVPLAAPSANASTKPSPTMAEHVLHDLDGRIEIILDGGPCQVGVESTVVDGLCDPPVVLRPGGVSIDAIRECTGWTAVVKGYKDYSETGADTPRAPGMKYKHYSPKAKVVLYEASTMKAANRRTQYPGIPSEATRVIAAKEKTLDHLGCEIVNRLINIGIVRTKTWGDWAGFNLAQLGTTEARVHPQPHAIILNSKLIKSGNTFQMMQGELWERSDPMEPNPNGQGNVAILNGLSTQEPVVERHIANVIEVSLGKDTKSIAHGLFSALRELDQRGVDVIYVEGIEDEGDIAAAVMNRLRKAATVIEK